MLDYKRKILYLFCLFSVLGTASAVFAGPSGNLIALEGHKNALAIAVSPGKRAAVFYDNLLICPSVAGFFEIYRYSITGKRQRLHSGPWTGSLAGNLESDTTGFVINGRDASSGAGYQASSSIGRNNQMEIEYSFSSLPLGSNLSIEILKLDGDLFKGSLIKCEPSGKDDIDVLPVVPRDVNERYLLKSKNRILIQAPMFEMEIVDVKNQRGINMADFRNVKWDPYKSFFLYADHKAINMIANPEFVYRITVKAHEKDPKAPSSKIVPEVTAYPEKEFTVVPRMSVVESGYFQMDRNVTLSVKTNPQFQDIFNDEIERRTGFRVKLAGKNTDPIIQGATIDIKTLSNLQKGNLPDDGFIIHVKPENVSISGADKRGCIYGAWAFMSLMKGDHGLWKIPCGNYRDWPDLEKRGICVEMLPPVRTEIDLFKRYLTAYSKAGANLVVFYHMPDQIQAWKDGTSEYAWSKAQMREVAAYAVRLGLDVWAGLSHKFRKKSHPTLPMKAGANIYDPFDSRSYAYLYPYYEELLSVYHPKIVLIGHDEIMGLNDYKGRGKHTVADGFSTSVDTIAAWMKKSGIGTAIWGDMLLDHEKWNDRVGEAHSGNKLFDSGETHLALDLLTNDIAIVDWHYRNRNSYPSIAYFAERNFSVYGCGWDDPETAKHMAQSVKMFGGKGVIGTDWGFWRTLSPAATTLYNTLCGWHTDCEVDEADEAADIRFLAKEMRKSVDTEFPRQIPLPIEKACNATTVDEGGGHRGVFNTGSMIDLRLFPYGDLDLKRTRFHVLSPEDGKRTNCIVVGCNAQGKENPAGAVSLSMGGKKCESIRILHTLFAREPQYRSKILGNYGIEYADGTFEDVEIIEGFNITDVRSGTGVRKNEWSFRRHPEILIGAECVWQGSSVSAIPLNVQMLTWKNPHPDKTLKRIQFKAKQTNQEFRIAILGITLLGS